MPTYEYACKKCGKVFEVWQKITDKPLEVCKDAHCKGKIKRAIGGGGGFILKGSGFYSTDYRSNDYKKKKASENAPPKPSTESSAAKKAESVPKKDA
jgi:putative FmdB family regulatory protein